MKYFVLLLTLAFISAADADTLYKVVGADGKISYTDQPPADAKSAKEMKFTDAPASPLPASVLKFREDLEKGMASRLAQAKKIDDRGTAVLYSASWCGYCKQAKAFLATNGIRYREVDIDTEDGARSYFAAGGGNGVPLLVTNGKSLVGFRDSSYAALFELKK